MTQELDKKIEQMSAEEQIVADNLVAAPEPTQDELTSESIVGAIQEGMDRAAIAVDEPAPMQVAGFKDVVIDLLQGAQKRTGQDIPDKPVQTIAGRTVIKEASDDELEAINSALGGEYVKGLNFPQIAENMGDFDLQSYFAQIKDANAELFEKARRGTVGFEAILEGAESRGIDNIALKMLNRNPGSPATAEEILGGIIASVQLVKETDKAYEVARALSAGPEREAAMTRAMQMLSAQGVLLSNVSGATSEAGRALYVAGAVGQKLDIPDIGERAERIRFLFDAQNADDVEHIGVMYMALKDPAAKSKFVEQGFISKSMNVVTEVWINSILSAPTTHAVNIAGNASFMMLRTAETALAGGIGRLRTMRPGSNPDRARARETLAQLEGMRRGLSDAILLAGRVMVKELPGDMSSKIDVRNMRSIGTTGDMTEIVNQVRSGNMAAAAVNTIGVGVRMPGRFLMAEDEFFKALGYRMAIHQEAIVASGNLYDELIAAGKTTEEAKALAAVEEVRFINDPPMDIVNSSKEAARQMTFQGDLDGILGSLQYASSHPIAKLFIPFFKTPTNIMKETLSRTPLAVLSPTIRRQIAAGGRDADIALSKIAMGSTIMSGFAYASMGIDDPDEDLIIVGKGPANREARQAMMRMGMQPYSVNKKIYTEDGRWTGKYHSTTFSRFDPVSGMLAMAADFAYYSQYETDQATLDQLAMSLAGSAAEYAVQMPFLQGVQELTGIFRDTDKLLENGTTLFTQKLTEAGLAFLPGTSSFAGGLERMGELGEGASGPAVGSSMLPAEGLFGEDPTTLPPFARGFYTALQRAKGRNPFFSDTVPARLNLWGEVMTTGTGSGWEMINPVRIKETKYNAVDAELMRLGQGIGMPQKRVSGVLLNAEQYNQILTDMNNTDGRGRQKGDEGFDVTTTLLPSMARFIRSPEYAQIPTDEDRLDALNTIVNKRKSNAIKKLRNEDDYLDTKILALQ